jgi:hypothetical protein
MSDLSGYAPPPRAGKPWWIWLVGGCGGCLVIILIGAVGLGIAVRNVAKNIKVGPVTPAAVEQQLAPVPVYPGAVLEPNATRGILTTYAGIEQFAMRRPQGSVFKGAGTFMSPDPPEKIWNYYDKQMAAGGWQRATMPGPKIQRQDWYQKGDDAAMIQVQQSRRAGRNGTVLVLIRSTREGIGAGQGGTPAAPAPQ